MPRLRHRKKWKKLVEVPNRICFLCKGYAPPLKGATMLRHNRPVLIHCPPCPGSLDNQKPS